VNDWIVFLTSSKVTLMAIFCVCAIVSVTGLEALRGRMARVQREGDSADAGPITKLVAVAALAYIVLLTTGGSGLFLVGRTFLNMTLTMFGIAGVLVIALLRWQFRSGTPLDADAERRRIAARDL
jgi:hypothetical protein